MYLCILQREFSKEKKEKDVNQTGSAERVPE